MAGEEGCWLYFALNACFALLFSFLLAFFSLEDKRVYSKLV